MQLRIYHWLIAFALAVLLHGGLLRCLGSGLAAGGVQQAEEGIEISLAQLPPHPDPLSEGRGDLSEQGAVSEEAESVDVPMEGKSVVTENGVAQVEAADEPAVSIPVPKAPPPRPPRPQQPRQKKTAQKKPVLASPAETKAPAVEPMPEPSATTIKADISAAGTRAAASASPVATLDTTRIRRDYMVQLSHWINRYKRYPRQAQRRGQQGTVQLRFVLDRGGRLLSSEVLVSPGYPLLEQAALDMLVRAAPLPPIPAELAQNRLEVVLPVAFNLR